MRLLFLSYRAGIVKAAAALDCHTVRVGDKNAVEADGTIVARGKVGAAKVHIDASNQVVSRRNSVCCKYITQTALLRKLVFFFFFIPSPTLRGSIKINK